MKLNSIRIGRALEQMNAQAIPETDPVVLKFNNLFGDHTFFIDQNGLNIVETIDTSGDAAATARVVKLARWADDRHSSLVPHAPVNTELLLHLDSVA